MQVVHFICMKASIRVNALTLGGTGDNSLPGMEAHGKRLDQTSKRRKVREKEPLVYRSLDLRKEYDLHVAGAKMNAKLGKPVLHAIIQYPTQLQVTEKIERSMLNNAVKFIDETHGGNAVFAARLDRDEKGRHNVDVFYSPRYSKVTKDGACDWISTSKFAKELCELYREMIERRHDGEFVRRPRQQGMALQEALYDFLKKKGLDLEPRTLKDHGLRDRVQPENVGLKRERDAALEEARLANIRAEQAEARASAAQARANELQNVERTLEINIEAFDEERSALLETIEWQENEIARLRILLGYDVTSDGQSGPDWDPF